MVNQNQTCILCSPSWMVFEKRLKSFQLSQCETENVYLRKAIEQRMQDSSLGSFLYNLNQTQLQQPYVQQDKLERMRFDISKGLVNLKKLKRLDDVCDNLLKLIDVCLEGSPTGTMTVKKVLRNMNVLRLTGSRITTMDYTLRGLGDLEALVLARNCLTFCPGGSLPRRLMILELCCNRLEDISSLANDPPSHLLYLGLARNCLSYDVLQPLKNFQYLYHLDLAHNDIEDLSGLITACSQLGNLSSLMLIGNPCSMSPNYSIFILENIPKLIFLDGEMLKKQEKNTEDDQDIKQHLLGVLQIYLFRVMGLPQPATEKINKKKVSHSYRLEMDSPLLRPYLQKKEASFIIDASLVKSEDAKKQPNNQDVKGKNCDKIKDDSPKSKKTQKQIGKSDLTKEKKKKSSVEPKQKNKKTSEDAKSKEEKDLDSKENHEAQMYELELKSDQKYPQECFKSEKKNWGKIITFNEPAIEVSNCNLKILRDVFRTNLTLRIVHLKTLPPVSKAKSKPKKQEKNTPSEENIPNEQNANKEVLVSKSTVAKIILPLQDILWNREHLDYAWTVTKPFTVELATELKDLQYVIKKKKEPKNKKGKVEDSSRELQIPLDLTCHLGVGVKREKLDGIAREI